VDMCNCGSQLKVKRSKVKFTGNDTVENHLEWPLLHADVINHPEQVKVTVGMTL